jgi:heavy metal sensor kinase
MRALPIRLRLTLAFALAMAVVLTAMGAFVYVRVSGALIGSVDQGLHGQAREAAARLAHGQGLAEPDSGEGTILAQIVDGSGHVTRSTAAGAAFADRQTVARALSEGPFTRTVSLPGRSGEWRILATPVRVQHGSAVLLLARSLAAREESLHKIERELLVAGPVALLLASLAGYLLAASALRPVELMRRRAEAISASTPGRRLPVPPSRDEISRLAGTLNDMLDRLEAAFAHERRFVADASHELRTPLALLRTELELALRRTRTPDELEAALRSAFEETDRLSQLAQDLLLIARADQGQLPIRRERLDAAQLLSDVASRFALRAAGLGRSLDVGVSEDVEVEADRLRLEQAIGNLVDNALVHGAGTVSLHACERARLVELHVCDGGRGFPEPFLQRAFARFSRGADARSSTGGTGLGLAIVELVAHAHGGDVGAANRPDGGADVWLALPAPARRQAARTPTATSTA